MQSALKKRIRRATGAREVFEIGDIQSLWDGYGVLSRYGLEGADVESIVVKYIRPPVGKGKVSRNTQDRSHRRKMKSYAVESVWYRDYAPECGEDCRVPQCLAIESGKHEQLMLLEDIDAAGFGKRRQSLTLAECGPCLRWLASFHASFLQRPPEGLWKVGTYWHLDTRPEELKALNDEPLRKAAPKIDQRLKSATYQTLVHGDAKLANFCFSPDGERVAAVDFQYAGAGCGMKDVAYFLLSCFSEAECDQLEAQVLESYFSFLVAALSNKQPQMDAGAIEEEWRELFPYAVADFYRFFKGWAPGCSDSNGYCEQVTQRIIAKLK